MSGFLYFLHSVACSSLVAIRSPSDTLVHYSVFRAAAGTFYRGAEMAAATVLTFFTVWLKGFHYHLSFGVTSSLVTRSNLWLSSRTWPPPLHHWISAPLHHPHWLSDYSALSNENSDASTVFNEFNYLLRLPVWVLDLLAGDALIFIGPLFVKL